MRISAVTQVTAQGKWDNFRNPEFDNLKLPADAIRGALGSMRAIRFGIVALVTVALALLPVPAAAGAVAPAPVSAEMSVAAPDDGGCPCCCGSTDRCARHECADHNGTDDGCTNGACMQRCHGTAAISIEPLELQSPSREVLVDAGLIAMAPYSARPDPPPPRS